MNKLINQIKDFYNTDTTKKVTVTIFLVVVLFASVFALVRPKDTVKDDVKITENKKEDIKVTEDKDKKDEKDDKKSDKKSDDKKTDKKTESKADSKPASNKPAPSKPAPSKPVEPAKPAHTHTWTPVYKDHPAQAEQGHYENVTSSKVIKFFPFPANANEDQKDDVYDAAYDYADAVQGASVQGVAGGVNVIQSTTTQKWVVDVPAKPAWREKTHEKCSCGATR